MFERKMIEQTLRIACNISGSENQIDLGSQKWKPLNIKAFANNGSVSAHSLKLPPFGFSILQII